MIDVKNQGDDGLRTDASGGGIRKRRGLWRCAAVTLDEAVRPAPWSSGEGVSLDAEPEAERSPPAVAAGTLAGAGWHLGPAGPGFPHRRPYYGFPIASPAALREAGLLGMSAADERAAATRFLHGGRFAPHRLAATSARSA